MPDPAQLARAIDGELRLAELRRNVKARQVTTHTHDAPAFDNVQALARVRHRDYQRIAPNSTWTFPTMEEPGAVTCIWLTLAQGKLAPLLGLANHAHRDLWISVSYDGADTPAIAAPLGHFFGNGTARYVHFQSRFVGMTAGGYFCFLPMPFARSCRVAVQNRHATRTIP